MQNELKPSLEEVDIFEEQPIGDTTSQTANAEQLDVKNDGESVSLEGSLLGKFKSAESLMDAYNNLQKEFTRKSQKLSELNKQLDEVKENAKKERAPLYESENWDEQVNNFLTANPSAKEYVAEISQVILNDKVLACAPHSLEMAFGKVLASKFSNLNELVEEEDFVNKYILTNQKIGDTVIKKYLSALRDNKGVPVISNHSGSSFSLAPKNKPNNLDEAKKLAEALFKI
ncbi:MAG: hypothetical protein PHC46_02380 [Clostridia bacterium]|nr:hypothetical protein [Clostridia bacterium]